MFVETKSSLFSSSLFLSPLYAAASDQIANRIALHFFALLIARRPYRSCDITLSHRVRRGMGHDLESQQFGSRAESAKFSETSRSGTICAPHVREWVCFDSQHHPPLHPSLLSSPLPPSLSPRTPMIRTMRAGVFYFLSSFLSCNVQRILVLVSLLLPLSPPKVDLGKSESLEVPPSRPPSLSHRDPSVRFPRCETNRTFVRHLLFPLTYIFTVMISIPSFL